MDQWPQLPDFILDYTKKLPWHPTKRWGKRKPSDIKGVCYHQTDGGDVVENTNAYHIGPNHISETGCPHICYSFYINHEGIVKICNPFEDVPWSQGTDKQPGSENAMLLSVVVGGKFRNSMSPNGKIPTQAALDAAASFWMWASQAFELTQADLFGHFDFGKTTCPGTDIEKWIKTTRTDSGLLILADVDDWQRSLVQLGFDLGKAGPGEDGVDGDWGPKSRKALYLFQRQYGIPLTGSFDRPTAWALRLAMAGEGVVSVHNGGGTVAPAVLE